MNPCAQSPPVGESLPVDIHVCSSLLQNNLAVPSRTELRTKWVDKHAKLRTENGIGTDFKKWATSEWTRLRGVPDTPRYRDVLNLCCDFYQKELLQKLSQERGLPARVSDLGDAWKKCPFVCDFTQHGTRKPWSRHARSLCADSKLYYFPRDRTLLAFEHLLLLGWTPSIDTA
eukprot:6485313-Amphidinium_carterae.1